MSRVQALATQQFSSVVMSGLERIYPWTDVLLYSGWRIQTHAIDETHRLLDPAGSVRVSADFSKCLADLNERKARGEIAIPNPRLVLMVHGMGRLRGLFRPLQSKLNYVGIEGHTYDYPSPGLDLATQTERLTRVLNRLEGIEEISFVTQSYGALVVRSALAKGGPWAERIRLGRLVMIVPPNQGSWVADQADKIPALQPIVGPAGWGITGKAAAELPIPNMPFLIIAGGMRNHRGLAPFLPGDNDGLIRVDETWLDGAAGRIVIPMIHFRSACNAAAMEAVVQFLLRGAVPATSERPTSGSLPTRSTDS
jgi:hypothetical protein